MIIYGKQIVEYALKNHRDLIETIYFSKDVDKKLFSSIRKAGIVFERVDTMKAQAMARGGNHQGMLAKIKPVEFGENHKMMNSSKLLVLVGVTDVGNIGSMVRSAHALGIDGIVLVNSKKINFEAIMRTSSGALFDFPIYNTDNIYDLVNELIHKEFTLIGTEMNGKDIREVKVPEKFAVFMGSEGQGLPKRLLGKMSVNTSIKMANQFDSLNVAVASAIIMDRLR